MSMQRIDQLLRDLNAVYREIPAMECAEGCSDCCGPIRWSLIEQVNIARWLLKRGRPMLVSEGEDCPYLEGGRCSIYPVRPYLCRIFGVARSDHVRPGGKENLTCPRVAVLERDMLSVERVRVLHFRIRMLSEAIALEGELISPFTRIRRVSVGGAR